MSSEQINEILKLLHIIADSSVANKIALISVVISGVAVLSSIYFSHRTRVQYIDGLSPLLSFHLFKKEGFLYMTIANTGHSEADEIEINFEELKKNGEQNKFVIADIFKNTLTLYPNEQITGCVAISGANIVTSIAPMVKVHISYRKGNTKKKEKYCRWICFSEKPNEQIMIEQNLKDIAGKLNEISYSNNRMANYFSGTWLLKNDEVNVQPQRTFHQDIKDAVNNIDRGDEQLIGRDKTGKLNL
ncbi:MAG: hypothetical protein ACI35P_01085 [Bacillus sp. (in: firmicutes)]